MDKDFLKEICGTCGTTFGDHRGDSICRNQCPDTTTGRAMDWNMNHITIFRPTGTYKD